MRPLNITTGQRFGRWTIREEAEPRIRSSGETDRYWLVQCDCGSEPRTVRQSALTCGTSQSCGCLQRELPHEQRATHGLRRAPEYKSWNA